MRNWIPSLLIFIPMISIGSPEKVSIEEILNLPAENRKLAALENREAITKDLKLYAHNSKLPMSTRWKSLMLLTEIEPAQAIGELLKSAQSSEWFMRNAALVGLESLNHERALEMAQSMIADKALVVRSAAVDVISKSLGPANRDLFWQELYKRYNFRAETSLWIRGQIVSALAQRPLDHEAKIFTQLLKDKDMQVQFASVIALEKLQGIKLGDDKSTAKQRISLWQDYARKNSL